MLSYSRTNYIEFVTDISTDTLLRCHNNSFRYLKFLPVSIALSLFYAGRIEVRLKENLNEQFPLSEIKNLNPLKREFMMDKVVVR